MTHDEASCTSCPICRVMTALRERDDPELRRLLETLGTVAASVLGLVDAVLDDRRRGAAPGPDVEHIDID
jgi:hypothetical protein